MKIYFIPESDSLEVQTLPVAVGGHQLPQVGLPLYLEAKERRDDINIDNELFVEVCECCCCNNVTGKLPT